VNTEPNEENTAEPKENEPEENDSEKTPRRKRKVAIKVSEKKVQRKTAKGRAKKKPRISSGDDSLDESDVGWFSPGSAKKKPLPGQFENCEICEKRFTVTAYSKTGPNGGLICNPCGKELGANDAASKKKSPKVTAAAKRRRTLQSERLDGIIRRGSKPLVQLCIETVLKYHDSIESFESIPDHLIHRICRLFSKHRVLNSQTLPLFIRGDLTVIEVFDCSCKCLWWSYP
jgi:DNA repair protein RAD7